ncbi:MAG TPA: M1 family aminopeptidase [Bryobacteraceae bacterium]|nr:M1 family aminopeptidase [Bryobacteraceae bacterium]
MPAPPSSPAAVVAAAMRDLVFEPERCWRVRDLSLAREDIKLYLSDGFVLFSRPLAGVPIAALFWAEVEGGDGEIIVLPPSAGERQSLARFTQEPNLNEHFRSAVLVFTDGTAAELDAFIRDNAAKPALEMGALLAGQYSPTLRNLTTSFESRLVQDLAGRVRPEAGLFFAAMAGRSHGPFDAVYDPQAMDQVVLAQLQNREGKSYYNIWTSFPSHRVRKDPGSGPLPRDFDITDVIIDATLTGDLRMAASVTLRIRIPESPGTRRQRNALAFDISRRVRIRSVTVNGAPAEVLQRENLRSELLRGNDNEVFLVALADALAPGEHTLVFQQEGDVILPAGNGVYFVSARGSWYPQHGLQFANYDLTFRCPRHLQIVATGESVEERVEGETRISRRRSTTPLRVAGFNLGEYKRSSASRGGLAVTVYANKAVEASLAPQRREVLLPTPPALGRPPRAVAMQPVVVQPSIPDPAAQINDLAAEVAESFEFFAARFGPPPLKNLAVSPIPGAFGQGFPGLIYLSTIAYLPPRERPNFASQGLQSVFFSDILVAHEVAHQWWGNAVTTTGYRDEWMMEAFANYAALLLLERKRGSQALREVLEKYKEHLLAKGVNGQSIDAAGPIHLGARLESSHTPEAYRALVYEKGTWIIHMLRCRLGDAAFFAMMRDANTRFLRSRFTASDLRSLAAAHQPKGGPDPSFEQFFTSFVDSTGIPSLKLQSRQKRTAKGIALIVDLDQSGVPAGYAIDVPIELDFGRGKSETRWLRTDDDRTSAEWQIPVAPLRVLLDPRNTVLAVRD